MIIIGDRCLMVRAFMAPLRTVFFAAGAALALSTFNAHADGLKEPIATVNWGGLYVGLSVGALSANIDGPGVSGGPTFAVSNEMVVPGLHAGMRQQFGSLVAGVELGLTRDGKWGSTLAGGFGAECGYIVNEQTCDARIRDIWQVGGRLGWAVKAWQVYATGGWAWAHLETRGRDIPPRPPGPFALADNTHAGWFIGGGVEYQVARNLFFGVEYQRHEFDSELHVPSGALFLTRDVSATADVIRARFSFKLSE